MEVEVDKKGDNWTGREKKETVYLLGVTKRIKFN